MTKTQALEILNADEPSEQAKRLGLWDEHHEAVGVADCRFFVASISKGARVIDTFESDCFDAGGLNVPVRTRSECEAQAVEWRRRKVAAIAAAGVTP